MDELINGYGFMIRFRESEISIRFKAIENQVFERSCANISINR